MRSLSVRAALATLLLSLSCQSPNAPPNASTRSVKPVLACKTECSARGETEVTFAQ